MLSILSLNFGVIDYSKAHVLISSLQYIWFARYLGRFPRMSVAQSFLRLCFRLRYRFSHHARLTPPREYARESTEGQTVPNVFQRSSLRPMPSWVHATLRDDIENIPGVFSLVFVFCVARFTPNSNLEKWTIYRRRGLSATRYCRGCWGGRIENTTRIPPGEMARLRGNGHPKLCEARSLQG